MKLKQWWSIFHVIVNVNSIVQHVTQNKSETIKHVNENLKIIVSAKITIVGFLAYVFMRTVCI